MMSTADAIISQIAAMGWRVTTGWFKGSMGYQAVKDGEMRIVKIDGVEDDSQYRAACELAKSCGVDLYGGRISN